MSDITRPAMHCASNGSPRKKARRRVWHVSPTGFRELRLSLFLSQQAVADALGVCLRTVRHWDSGRNRVPWSAVRLLRLLRGGDLGELSPVWAGWRILGDALVTPAGVPFQASQFTWWALTCLQARSWQRAFQRATSWPSASRDAWAFEPVIDGGVLELILQPQRHGVAHGVSGQGEVSHSPLAEACSGAASGLPLARTATVGAMPKRDVRASSDANMASSPHQIPGFSPVRPVNSVIGIGPDTNRGQKGNHHV